jgi:hypothetical protein
MHNPPSEPPAAVSAESTASSIGGVTNAETTLALRRFLEQQANGRAPSIELREDDAGTHLDFHFPGAVRGTILVTRTRPAMLSCRIANSWESFHETAVFSTVEETQDFLMKIIRIARRYSVTALGSDPR